MISSSAEEARARSWVRFRRVARLRELGVPAIVVKREQLMMALNRRGVLNPQKSPRYRAASPALMRVALDLENLNHGPEPGGEVGSR